MRQAPVFLTAEWRKLLMFNFEVDPDVLKPFLPAHTELDLFKQKCYVSLVGFMFLNTKLKGVKIPFHTNFEEVNLRFYVKHFSEGEWKRGVVFVKEIVPRPALTIVANSFFDEHYQTMPMRHNWVENIESLHVLYEWNLKGKWQKMEAVCSNVPASIVPGSEEEFITEHYWGYTKKSVHKTTEYAVEHPVWEIYPVIGSKLNIDFEKVYGSLFRFLNFRKPASVFLAEGSNIVVRGKKVIG